VVTHHTAFCDSGLAAGLKQARENKGLSQRTLGIRIAVPQSHISKIESGKVDIKASSLIEFARALDLEVMLVPRSLVPAVEALSRPRQERNETDIAVPRAQQPDEAKSVLRVRRLLEHLQKDARRIVRTFGPLPEITRLSDAARALDQIRLTPEYADQALQALKEINLRSEALKQAQSARTPMSRLLDSDDFKLALQEASRAADKLRNIRNAWAHGPSAFPARSLPAYRLSDGADDGA
jgi:transcriptional regulator with XRE-family HTH domain